MGVTRLRLKGEKKKKRKRDDGDKEKDKNETSDVDLQRWINIRSCQDFNGPVVLMTLTNEKPSVLQVDLQRNEAEFTNLENGEDIVSWAPNSINQVLIASRLSDNRVTFKLPNGRFLGVDSAAGLVCDAVAANPTEIFEIIQREDGFSLKSFKGFLSCTSNGVARGDSENIGCREVFTIKTQFRFLAKGEAPLEEEVGRDSQKIKDFVMPLIKKHQSSQSYRNPIITTKNVKIIKSASKEGNLHEALLNLREKSKSDKFCK